jgi:hypothetical protein
MRQPATRTKPKPPPPTTAASTREALEFLRRPAILQLQAEKMALGPDPDDQNPIAIALKRCREAYATTFWAIVKQHGETATTAERAACSQYRCVMPMLTDSEEIRAYVACVAQGIQLQVFTARDASQMLYAAQVSNSLQPRFAQPLAATLETPKQRQLGTGTRRQ